MKTMGGLPESPEERRNRQDGNGEASTSNATLLFRVTGNVPDLIAHVFEAKGYFEQEDEESGVWHVHWRAGRFKPSEYAAANPLQRVNHFPKTTGITKKDALLRNLRRMRGIHGPVFNFLPESYILPNEYMMLVRNCEQQSPDEPKPIWILKPTDSSQGRKIFLIRDVSEISYGHFANSMTADHLLSDPPPTSGTGGSLYSYEKDPKLDEKGRAIQTELDMSTTLRMLKSRLNKTVTPCVKFTEAHLIQRYVDRPICFCGYKLDLRLYVLLLSAQPLRVYWFNDCLMRFATQKYNLNDLENNYSHLTNTSINKNSASYGTDKEGIRAGCKWSLLHFMREHPTHTLNSKLLWDRIKAIVNLTLLSIAGSIPDNGGCFELLGYDIIVDESLKPWLLEVNASPSLGIESEADTAVKQPLISNLVDFINVVRKTFDAPKAPSSPRRSDRPRPGPRATTARSWRRC